jgi:hypothetical protein
MALVLRRSDVDVLAADGPGVDDQRPRSPFDLYGVNEDVVGYAWMLWVSSCAA